MPGRYLFLGRPDEERRLIPRDAAEPGASDSTATHPTPLRPGNPRTFETLFAALFDAHYARLFRYLDRLSGDPDVAADLAQDAFVRLYQRGSMPETPSAWLITVAMNLFRNVRSSQSRRLRLLTPERGARAHADAAPPPDAGIERGDVARRVRQALDQLSARERQLLLLRAEGYRYREMALALELNEASVGTLLARAQREFRLHYGARDGPP